MVSMWWVLVAAPAGVLVIALMLVAAGLPDQSAARIDLSEMPR
jgi:hypothetical protein